MSENVELSTELYVNEHGLLIETDTHNEVLGLTIMYDEESCEAWFEYITPLTLGNYNEDDNFFPS
tara:strand:+ start:384 stop:578 length:195 start_codon:yes stop_codon:yes gene_type:complete